MMKARYNENWTGSLRPIIMSPSQHLEIPGGGGGVLPYMGYIGMCRPIGYGF